MVCVLYFMDEQKKNLEKVILSIAIVFLFVAMGGINVMSDRPGSAVPRQHYKIEAKNVVMGGLADKGNITMDNLVTTYNWAGYCFFDAKPWYYFTSTPYEIDWVSEYIHVPTTSPPPATDTEPSLITMWDALSSNSQGDNMYQAGIQIDPYNGCVSVVCEHFAEGVPGHEKIYDYASHNKKPVLEGQNLYIYLVHNQNKFTFEISDISNGCVYENNTTITRTPLTPRFFLSVIETPTINEVNGEYRYFSVPPFTTFVVNSLVYQSNEKITGASSYNSGSYGKYTLRQSGSISQNIKTSFSTACSPDGGYSVQYCSSDYT